MTRTQNQTIKTLLDGLEASALVATLIAVWLTVHVALPHPGLYEANPVADALLQWSFYGAAIIAFTGIIAAFTVLRWGVTLSGRGSTEVAVACGIAATVFSSWDAARNAAITHDFAAYDLLITTPHPSVLLLAGLTAAYLTARHTSTLPGVLQDLVRDNNVTTGQARAVLLTGLMISSLIAMGVSGMTGTAAASSGSEYPYDGYASENASEISEHVEHITAAINDVSTDDDYARYHVVGEDGEDELIINEQTVNTVDRPYHAEVYPEDAKWYTITRRGDVIAYELQPDSDHPLGVTEEKLWEFDIWDRVENSDIRETGITSDGEALYALTEAGELIKINTEDQNEEWYFDAAGEFDAEMTAIAVNPDTNAVTVVGEDWLVTINDGDDPRDGDYLLTQRSHDPDYRLAEYSGDGENLFVVGEERPDVVEVYDETGTSWEGRDFELPEDVVFEGSGDEWDAYTHAETLAGSPDGYSIAIGMEDSIGVFDTVSGGEIWSRDTGTQRYALDWSPDSRELWTTAGGHSDDVLIYDHMDGSEIDSLDWTRPWHGEAASPRPLETWGASGDGAPETDDDEHAAQVLEAHPDDPDLDDIAPGNSVTDAKVTVYDSDGTEIDTAFSDSNGWVVIEGIDEDGDYYDVEVEIAGEVRHDREHFLDSDAYGQYGVVMSDPELDDGTASPSAETVDGNESEVTLEIDVANPDHGHEFLMSDVTTVEFYKYETGDPDEDELIGTDTLTSDRTASVDYDLSGDTDEEWYVYAHDRYDYTEPQFSDVHSFDVDVAMPETLDDTASPHDETVTGTETDLSIDVDHEDFPDTNVTVEFYKYETGDPDEDELIGSESLDDAGTASTTWEHGDGDLGEWYVVAEDDEGIATISDVYWFLIEDTAPELLDDTASPDGVVPDGEDIELEIDVEHEDFPDENVDVTFHEYSSGDPDEDEVIGSDTLDDAGTASVTWDSDEGGAWYAVAEDSGEAIDVSTVFVAETTGELEIRDAETGELIDDRTVRLEITAPDYSDTIDVSDGTLPYSDLPVDADEEVLIDVRAQDYYETTIQIPSLVTDDTAYLERGPDWHENPEEDDPEDTADPDEDDTKVVVRFTLDDQSGAFSPDDTTLRVTRDDENNTHVHSESFGSLNRVDVVLDQDDRYQLQIDSPDDTRSLGGFTATQSETVPIEIEDISYPLPDPEQYEIQSGTTEEAGQEYIRVQYADPVGDTHYLDVTVRERGNTSNVLHTETAYNLGNQTIMIPITEEQAGQQWVVEYAGERDGQQIEGYEPVGGDHTIALPGPQSLITALALIGLTVLAALYSGPLAAVGGLILVGAAGVLILFGWLPVSPAVWFVALVIAAGGAARAANSPGGGL